ncbi:3-dehydroquinate synthase [Sphingobacteriales bacterium UPWRP_1]|nr:3-dehydroquinate synthase [Sphingobacteriales bacterium TSM_CSS]PSJ77515.1 3-dehydroquinate synthase [Sphingobacteriales bacterium UPWRP_1]
MANHQLSEIRCLNLPEYPVYIGNIAKQVSAFLQNNRFSGYFILVDANTCRHCLPVLQNYAPSLQNAVVITIEPGEIHKNLNTCTQIWDALLTNQADRNALLINLGGGVIGDMGGFCAATYKRGINFIQIPTTLLAQVDASVGAKVGIDFGGIKNSIGAFSNPSAVFIDPVFLNTLPPTQILSGLSEMVKHALIADANILPELGNLLPLTPLINWSSYIYQSVSIKYDIVKADPFEKNVRKKLNFGHTIGHGIESFSLHAGSEPLLHGQAVALGMIAELYLSEKKLQLPQSQLQTAVNLLRNLAPSYPIQALHFPKILHYIANDKKNKEGNINCTLLTQIGAAQIDCTVSEQEITEALHFLNNLFV